MYLRQTKIHIFLSNIELDLSTVDIMLIFIFVNMYVRHYVGMFVKRTCMFFSSNIELDSSNMDLAPIFILVEQYGFSANVYISFF